MANFFNFCLFFSYFLVDLLLTLLVARIYLMLVINAQSFVVLILTSVIFRDTYLKVLSCILFDKIRYDMAVSIVVSWETSPPQRREEKRRYDMVLSTVISWDKFPPFGLWAVSRKVERSFQLRV